MRTSILLAAVAGVLAAPAAMADHDDHHGHGHAWGHEKHHEEFWDGNCHVEREFKHGQVHEKRTCRLPEHELRAVRVVPVQPLVVPAQPVVVLPWMVQEQGQYAYKPKYRPAEVAGTSRCNSEVVGGVLGGIVGGALGHQIGAGNGRTLATIGGAVAGVLVGGDVGRRMDARNQACVGEVLEVAPVGHRVQWAQGATDYVVVPGKVAYVQGAYCRPYTLEVHTEHGPQKTHGTACRRPDGVWVPR